jgi:SAM-dependent methyltransferase
VRSNFHREAWRAFPAWGCDTIFGKQSWIEYREVGKMTYEPSSLEIWITTAVGRLASSTYRAYIERLPLQGNERVLELGPSAGNSTRHLAKRLLAGGGCVTAVDISARWIEVAGRQLRGCPNVELRLGDIGALDIPDHSFDAAFISFVVHDIPASEQLGVLEHVTAKVRAGGSLFIREPLRFIEAERLRCMLISLGWQEQQAAEEDVFSQGRVYEGIWVGAGTG